MRVVTALIAFFCAAVVLLSMPECAAQPDGSGTMRVETDMTVSGLDPLDCEGKLEVGYSGQAAVHFREKVFSHYDSDVNQVLDVGEVRDFLVDYSRSLHSRTYWGITIRSTTDFANLTDSEVRKTSSGLVYERSDSVVDLSVKMDFEGSGVGSAKLIVMVQGALDVFGTVANETLGYVFEGTLIIKQRLVSMGIGSILDAEISDGSLSVVRTVVGFIATYDYEGEVGPSGIAEELVRYEVFSVFENSQVAFVLVLIGSFMVLRMPSKGFTKYKMLHARKFRKYAKPLASVRYVSFGLTAFMVFLYFFPTLFLLGSSGQMVYTSYLYMIVPVVIIGQFVATRVLYERAALDIPEELVIEVKQALVEPEEGKGELLCKVCYRPIEAGLEMFQCGCGVLMHVSCAERVRTCPSCEQLLFPERVRSIQCRVCGESFLYSGGDDPYLVQCSKCGAFQEEVKPGKNYLVVDRDPRNAYAMVRSMAVTGRPTLCLTTEFPGKIRGDYDLGEMEIKWLSDSTTDIDNVNPGNLEGEAMEAVSTFLQTTKQSGLLVDGIEKLIELNGFDKTLTFVRRINDLATLHGSTIILVADKEKLPQEQFRAISDEFDEIHDYL